jgi:hypothetical protein
LLDRDVRRCGSVRGIGGCVALRGARVGLRVPHRRLTPPAESDDEHERKGPSLRSAESHRHRSAFPWSKDHQRTSVASPWQKGQGA